MCLLHMIILDVHVQYNVILAYMYMNIHVPSMLAKGLDNHVHVQYHNELCLYIHVHIYSTCTCVYMYTCTCKRQYIHVYMYSFSFFHCLRCLSFYISCNIMYYHNDWDEEIMKMQLWTLITFKPHSPSKCGFIQYMYM